MREEGTEAERPSGQSLGPQLPAVWLYYIGAIALCSRNRLLIALKTPALSRCFSTLVITHCFTKTYPAEIKPLLNSRRFTSRQDAGLIHHIVLTEQIAAVSPTATWWHVRFMLVYVWWNTFPKLILLLHISNGQISHRVLYVSFLLKYNLLLSAQTIRLGCTTNCSFLSHTFFQHLKVKRTTNIIWREVNLVLTVYSNKLILQTRKE